tara:strand:- start:168 stop:1301 length:1134 start_codon:yes stop_codon:yes gene_type:complete
MPYISLQLLHRWWHGFPMQVHIDRAGQRFGPYPIEQVNALLADGTLLETDLGWTDGMAEWLPLSQVQGVILPGQTPAAPPPPPVGTNSGVVQASGSSKKKLMIGVGATVGVLALAAVGFFVLKPMLSKEAEIAENEDLPDGELTSTPPMTDNGAKGKGGMQGGMGGFQGGMGGKSRPQGMGGMGGGNPMQFDRNKDGKLSKQELPQQMSRMFDRMDRNKDGFVTQDELRPQMGGGGNPKGRPQAGGIDPFTGLPIGTGGNRPQSGGMGPGMGSPGGVPVRIAQYDSNKDGKLSKQEVPEQLGRIFDFIDRNKDGYVTQDELQVGGSMRPGGNRPQGGGNTKGRPQQGGRPIDPVTGLPIGSGTGRPRPNGQSFPQKR